MRWDSITSRFPNWFNLGSLYRGFVYFTIIHDIFMFGVVGIYFYFDSLPITSLFDPNLCENKIPSVAAVLKLAWSGFFLTKVITRTLVLVIVAVDGWVAMPERKLWLALCGSDMAYHAALMSAEDMEPNMQLKMAKLIAKTSIWLARVSRSMGKELNLRVERKESSETKIANLSTRISNLRQRHADLRLSTGYLWGEEAMPQMDLDELVEAQRRLCGHITQLWEADTISDGDTSEITATMARLCRGVTRLVLLTMVGNDEDIDDIRTALQSSGFLTPDDKCQISLNYDYIRTVAKLYDDHVVKTALE